RMIRADYCGDGTSWTVNGRRINVYDGLGVQTDTASWSFEAEWDAHGARCLHATRVRQLQDLGVALPSCLVNRFAPWSPRPSPAAAPALPERTPRAYRHPSNHTSRVATPHERRPPRT